MNDRFTRLINLAALGKGLFVETFEANDEECAILAKRFDISALSSFTGRFEASLEDDGGVILEGQISAKLVQPCRFSLDPVEEELQESFRVRFLRDLPEDELEWDEIDEGDLERLEGENVDAGEIAAQYLGMSINPYPEKPGASSDDLARNAGLVLTEDEAKAASSPFASLKKIKDSL